MECSRIANVVTDDGEDRAFEILGQRELLLRALNFGLLSFASLRNVQAAAYETGKVSRLVFERHTPIKKFAVLAVMAPQAIFHLERFTSREMVQVVRHAAFDIVWMHSFGPAVAQFLLECPS